jgi:hypothetical protein
MWAKKAFSIEMNHMFGLVCNPDLGFPRNLCQITSHFFTIGKGRDKKQSFLAGLKQLFEVIGHRNKNY